MIDFTLSDLAGLYSMYESFNNLIKDYNYRLVSDELISNEENIFLKSRIDYFNCCISEIKKEIQKKWDGKSIYSREYIFNITKILNGVLSFEFRPNSIGYSKYGKEVIGFGIYKKSLEKELFSNLSSNPPINTNGNVRIKVSDEVSCSKKIIRQLATEGFETVDVFQVSGIIT